MTAQHPELAAGRWQTLSLMEQLANVGSEVERALNWAAKGNAEYSDGRSSADWNCWGSPSPTRGTGIGSGS